MKQLEPREVDTRPARFPDRLPWDGMEGPEGQNAVRVVGRGRNANKLLCWDGIRVTVPPFGEVQVNNIRVEVAAGDITCLVVSFYIRERPTNAQAQAQAMWAYDYKVEDILSTTGVPTGVYMVTISMPVSHLVVTSAVRQGT